MTRLPDPLPAGLPARLPNLTRPTVLVFAGLDPSGGAGLAADVLAIAAMGAHALPVATAITVQDNDRVYDVSALDAGLVERQAMALTRKMQIHAVKLGIPGSAANAAAIARVIRALRERHPALPVVLDPVLASGHGDDLTPLAALELLLPLASLVTPNLPEAALLAACAGGVREQGSTLRQRYRGEVLITGGHAVDDAGNRVVNRWFGPDGERVWSWPRLAGAFHGSGCTLAAAIAARLACGDAMGAALDAAQSFTHEALAGSFSIACGQRIPARSRTGAQLRTEQFI
ncbi:MAG: hydroxymethylpyrimidine/phosphomethylpyrimidine kinase [Massilia sp.]|nr:hydroxymethylpyrimidine/phosphomethylpyrimidine kinase [Massilia sp.]